jgi:hypothetical protein
MSAMFSSSLRCGENRVPMMRRSRFAVMGTYRIDSFPSTAFQYQSRDTTIINAIVGIETSDHARAAVSGRA